MFARLLQIDRMTEQGEAIPCPVKWIDSFSMRNFTNDAVFDDTLPVADGLLEAGYRVPLDLLQGRMEDWFRRKQYLAHGESLRVQQAEASCTHAENFWRAQSQEQLS